MDTVHDRSARLATPLVALAVLAAGCTSAPAPPAAAPAATPEDRAQVEGRVGELEAALDEERQAAAAVARENAELRQRLAEAEAARASLEERYATLEFELAGAVEEVLRSTAAGRGVRSRAFATSRISEVRVLMQSVPNPEDLEVAARLAPARDFLGRADQALAEENYGGASYLAERASELIRRARIVAELRSSSERTWGNVIPIVPPRRMRVLANTNLRAGPGLEEERIGGVPSGAEVLALARSGEWLQVETDTGLKAWIHGRLAQSL